MTWPRAGLGVLLVLTAVVVQLSILARLPAPGGGRPDLVLVLVVAVALVEGPLSGLVLGFGAGLALDLLGDHPLGLLALVFCLVGYGAGLLLDAAERSTFAPLAVVAASAVAAAVLYALLAFLTGDPRATPEALVRGLTTSVLYDVVLAPFVVPSIGILSRALDPDGRR